MKLRSLALQVVEAVDLEVSAVIDLHASHEQECRAKQLHNRLRKQFLRVTTALPESRGRIAALAALRTQLAALINSASDHELKEALVSHRAGREAKVLYVVNDGSGSEEAEFAFDSSQLPFMRHHDVALAAAIRLRTLTNEQQWLALEACAAIEEVWLANVRADESVDEEKSGPIQMAEKALERLRSKMDATALIDAQSFHDALAFGGMNNDALPIAVDPNAPVRGLCRVAQAYANFGGELRLFGHCTLKGRAAERERAHSAWLRYAAHGLCIKVLAAWIRAAAFEEEHHVCCICYRHAAGLKRCSEHATKSHETREGRLGKRVRPSYLARTARLARIPSVREGLGASLRPGRECGPEIRDTVRRMAVPQFLFDRCVLLADQLHSLESVFEQRDGLTKAMTLFCEIVEVAKSYAGDRGAPVLNSIGRRGPRVSQGVADRAYELLSLKGFFHFWFGVRTEPYFGSLIRNYGFDKYHPAVYGLLDPDGLSKHLLRQRAWEESYLEFVTKLMPDSREIQPLRQKMTVRETAAMLKISHQTLYNNLQLPREARKRNKLKP